ncbi:Single-stranded DNA-binding protein 2 [Takifugu flavidus]|uniref:Single-stranded DNA-binding protein 2 n=1 Tax=Takifugu flavidus TaxID=433684 RepID=A0A5C6MTY6_9TELE|nr:Single-stranded DNA-binding protein 2 [Takifugu flavidus]
MAAPHISGAEFKPPHHPTFGASLHSRAVIKGPFGVGPVQPGVGLMNSYDVFWDLYCAAPDRRETCEHSSEAKAFHDYVSEPVIYVLMCMLARSDNRSSSAGCTSSNAGVKGHGTARLFIGGPEARAMIGARKRSVTAPSNPPAPPRPRPSAACSTSPAFVFEERLGGEVFRRTSLAADIPQSGPSSGRHEDVDRGTAGPS